jgi:hypothetical protein
VAVGQGPVNRSIGDNNVDRPGSAASCRRYWELNAVTYVRTYVQSHDTGVNIQHMRY